MSKPINADALEDAVRRGGVSVLLAGEVLELFSKLRQAQGSADEWWKEYDKSQTELRKAREVVAKVQHVAETPGDYITVRGAIQYILGEYDQQVKP